MSWNKTIIPDIQEQLQSRTRFFLYLLLAGDLFYGLLYLAHKGPILKDLFPVFRLDVFSIRQDLGLAESFQYVKEAWLFGAFFVLFYRKKYRTLFLTWGLFFFYLFLDDAFQFHETLGFWLGDWYRQMEPMPGNPVFLGEITAYLLLGGTVFLMVFLAHIFTAREHTRVNRVMLTFTVLLVGTSISFDVLHSLLDIPWQVNIFVVLMEEWGEMIMMSALCWFGLTRYFLEGLYGNKIPAPA